MSYTYYGYAVTYRGRLMSKHYKTYGEAYREAARIAATEEYTYRYFGFMFNNETNNRLPANWQRLNIEEHYDMGGGTSTAKTYRVSRKRLEAERARPYPYKTSLEDIERPEWAPLEFTKQVKEKTLEAMGTKWKLLSPIVYRFDTARIDHEDGGSLELIYRETSRFEEDGEIHESKGYQHIRKGYADKWADYGITAQRFEETEAAYSQPAIEEGPEDSTND